jgi:hypothetical protein
MRLRKILACASLGAALIATPTTAHHSGAMFDQTKLISLDGTLVTYKFIQPHSWLTIDARRDKETKVERWDIEAASTTTMRRMGITPDVIKPGMKLTLGVHPLRDGRRGGSLVSVTINGKTYKSEYTQNPYGSGRRDTGEGARVKER